MVAPPPMFRATAATYPGMALMALVFAWGGCGKDSAKEAGESVPAPSSAVKSAPQPKAPSQPEATPEPASPKAPTGPSGTITGTIRLEGKAPEMPLLRRGSDPACDNGELRAETIVVDGKGGLANALVRIKPGTVPAFTPTEPIVVDQSDCMYRPRVSGGVRGQTVEVLNSDKTTHNVHARHLPMGERKSTDTLVNRAQPSGVAMSFELGDEPVAKLKCDYHAWMQGFVVVSDNPYFAVTKADGSFSLEGAPAGEQTLEVWHEFYGVKEAKVVVKADESVAFDASFDAEDDNPMATGETK